MRGEWFNELEIRRVAYSCTSNAQAALLLKVTETTWKRYASMFIEPSTQLTYFDYLKQKTKKKVKKPTGKQRLNTKKIDSIINGEVKYRDKNKLFYRLISEGIKHERCDMCDFCQPNVATGKIPLILNFIDENPDNLHISNLEILCYNCAATTTNLTCKWTNYTTNSD